MLREAITNLLSKEGSNRKMDIVLISGAYIFWDGNVDVWWGASWETPFVTVRAIGIPLGWFL